MSRLFQLVDEQVRICLNNSCQINEIFRHTGQSKEERIAFELIQTTSKVYNTTSISDIEVYLKKLLATGNTVNLNNQRDAAMSVVVNICALLKLNLLLVNETDILNGYRKMLHEPKAELDEHIIDAFNVIKKSAIERNISDVMQLIS
jgi:hypothetical protein